MPNQYRTLRRLGVLAGLIALVLGSIRLVPSASADASQTANDGGNRAKVKGKVFTHNGKRSGKTTEFSLVADCTPKEGCSAVHEFVGITITCGNKAVTLPNGPTRRAKVSVADIAAAWRSRHNEDPPFRVFPQPKGGDDTKKGAGSKPDILDACRIVYCAVCVFECPGEIPLLQTVLAFADEPRGKGR